MKEYYDLARERPDKKDIILKLKQPAHDIAEKMERVGVSRWSKENYHKAWNTIEWKQAKALLIQYFKENGVLICPHCKERLLIKDVRVHHTEYFKEVYKIFLPSIIWLVHDKCHKEIHKDKESEKE